MQLYRLNPHWEMDKTFLPSYSPSQITYAEVVGFSSFRFHRKRTAATASASTFRFHISASRYWNVTRFKSKTNDMVISGDFYLLGMWKTRKYVCCVAMRNPSGKCAKLHTVAASSNGDHPTRSLDYCLFMPHSLYTEVGKRYFINSVATAPAIC